MGKPTCHISDDGASEQLEEISAKYVIGADGKLNVYGSDQNQNIRKLAAFNLRTYMIVMPLLGAYSWIRRAIDIDMQGEQTGAPLLSTRFVNHTNRSIEDVWGVVDILANTDFPDMRFKCIVQRSSGPLIVG